MDKKSALIGALGTALLFVCIGATTQQDANQVIQVIEDPFPWEITVNYDEATKALLLNKKTGEVYYLNPNRTGEKVHNDIKLH